MTPEQIEAKAQEAFKNGTYNDKMYDWLQENRRAGYITGALSRQPELDTLESENTRLRERVREMQEGLKQAIILIGYLDENSKIHEDEIEHYGNLYMNTTGLIDQLLTKPADSTGGGEKVGMVEDVCHCDQLMRCSMLPDLCAYCGNEFRG